MLKLTFTNAQVEDHGFGLTVNGRDLDEIISTALGTRVGNTYGHNSGLPVFKRNCCKVTVTIEPQPVSESIETGAEAWFSVKDMEKDKREQYKEKAGKE